MKVTYDAQADALYIQLREGKFVRNWEVAEGIILDIGEDEALLGIEILDASSRLTWKDLARVEVLMPLELATVPHDDSHTGSIRGVAVSGPERVSCAPADIHG